MKKSIAVVLSLLLAIVFSFAQIPDTIWTKTFGGSGDDLGRSVQQTADGGYIVAGYTASYGAGSTDVYLIKTDATGNPFWTRTYGGSNDDNAFSVQQTTDGGYIIAGRTRSFGSGARDFWLIKTNANGDTTWTRTFGASGEEEAHTVQQTSDGGYILAGVTNSFGAGGFDVWVIKTDSLGNGIWTRTFGGSGYDTGSSAEQTYDGGYIIVAMTQSFGSGGDVYLIRTDANGDTLWTRTYGGPWQDYGTFVKQTVDSGFVLTGWIRTSSGENDLYIVKVNSSGDEVWTRAYGGGTHDGGYCIDRAPGGGYIIAGYTESFGAGDRDVWLIRTDSLGIGLGTKTYGGTNYDCARLIQQTSDGGYILAGTTNSFGAGDYDVWLLKIDSETGVSEELRKPTEIKNFGFTLFSGPLLLPKDKNCKVLDITGRVVTPDKIKPGIYFIEIDGQIASKVVKVR